jgi:hypothetical protein
VTIGSETHQVWLGSLLFVAWVFAVAIGTWFLHIVVKLHVVLSLVFMLAASAVFFLRLLRRRLKRLEATLNGVGGSEALEQTKFRLLTTGATVLLGFAMFLLLYLRWGYYILPIW